MKKILLAQVLISFLTSSSIFSEVPIYVDFDTACGKEDPRSQGFFHAVENYSRKPGWAEPGRIYLGLLRTCFNKLFHKQNEPDSQPYRIPKIIHIIWLGSPFPKKYINWMNSWKLYHPDWSIIIWNDEMAKSLHLVNRDLYEKAANYGEASDILRYEILYQFGGLYIDTDYECVKPFDSFHKSADFYGSMMPLWGCQAGEVWLINGILGSKPGHPFLKKLIDSLKDERATYIADRVGILKLTKEFFDYLPHDELISVAFPSAYFFPYVHSEKPADLHGDWRNAFGKKWAEVKNETYAIHWGENSWNAGVIDEK
ncbi:hypothetical protein HYX58_05805 [Candidatus Dependentiae bacterium]|nr:hypothetical protein [Candidatus Dependentiae bacterium]